MMPVRCFRDRWSMAPLALLVVLTMCVSACVSQPACRGDVCAEDAAITSEVRNALSDHPALQSWQLGVQSIDHVVYLRGLVDTEREKAEAETLARAVAKVSDVVNSIAVRNAAGN